MYDDILNPAGWATCNDAVALICLDTLNTTENTPSVQQKME